MEVVDYIPSDTLALLDLNGAPIEGMAINPLVADQPLRYPPLNLLEDPILEFKWLERSQFRLGLRCPDHISLRDGYAQLVEPSYHQLARSRGHVDPDPLSTEPVCYGSCRPTATE